MTFEQLTQAMAKGAASRKSSKQSDGDQANQMKLDAHISQSGATREIDGKKAKEALLTMTMLANANDGSNVQAGMAATMEMWLIDSAPGMEEMRAFSTRMAKELGVEAANSPVARSTEGLTLPKAVSRQDGDLTRCSSGIRILFSSAEGIGFVSYVNVDWYSENWLPARDHHGRSSARLSDKRRAGA